MNITFEIRFPALEKFSASVDRAVDWLAGKQQKQIDELVEKLKLSGDRQADALGDASHSG